MSGSLDAVGHTAEQHLSGACALVLLATVAAAAARGAPGREIALASLASTVAAVLVFQIARTRSRSGVPAALGLALAAATVGLVWLAGLRPGVQLVAYAPLLVVAAGTLGVTTAFLIADALVLVWALLAGLAAGGWLGIAGELPVAPLAVGLALASALLFLNGVVVSAAWAFGARDPVRIRELERRSADRDRLAEQMTRWEPLATSGRLVANVAHEVTNPLQAMHHLVHLLLEDTPAPDPRREQILLLRGAVERIALYVEQLSDFHRANEDPGSSDVNATVRDVLRFLERQLETANVKLSQELQQALPPAAIGSAALRQVLLNVILNGVESMQQGGELLVSSRVAGGWLQLVVRDTGRGVETADPARADTPGPPGPGPAGDIQLGLMLTRRMLQRHGGRIRIDGMPGAGTEVTLELPAAEGAA